MYEQRILHRLERRIGGVRAGSAGYVWSVGSRGDQYRSVERGEGIRRQLLEPSTTFLEHTLAVADAHLSLIEAARLGVFELVRVETEPDSWRSFMGRGAAETLRSDLFAITASGDYEDCWFIEVDRGTESLPTLVRKCQQYERYRGSGSEQADTGTFPLVLWVLPNQARIDKLTTALNRARAVDASLFRLTTPDGFVDVVRKGPG